MLNPCEVAEFIAPHSQKHGSTCSLGCGHSLNSYLVLSVNVFSGTWGVGSGGYVGQVDLVQGLVLKEVIVS